MLAITYILANIKINLEQLVSNQGSKLASTNLLAWKFLVRALLAGSGVFK